jgi:hypothetical protein
MHEGVFSGYSSLLLSDESPFTPWTYLAAVSFSNHFITPYAIYFSATPHSLVKCRSQYCGTGSKLDPDPGGQKLPTKNIEKLIHLETSPVA